MGTIWYTKDKPTYLAGLCVQCADIEKTLKSLGANPEEANLLQDKVYERLRKHPSEFLGCFMVGLGAFYIQSLPVTPIRFFIGRHADLIPVEIVKEIE